MMQNSIALVGLGEIGSRHLQALTVISSNTDLYCIDPNVDSMKLARSRISHLVKAKDLNLFFHDSMRDLPSYLDLVIIATSSDIRLKVLKEITLKSDIKNILFEKVLFQKTHDLIEADNILRRNKIKSWVNCPRRFWPVYSEVKALLEGKDNIKFELVGGSWGMACNFIHYLDIFEWISGSRVIEIDINSLDKEIFESKRQGFFEFTGMINANFSNENKMSLISTTDNNLSLISISAPGISLELSESSGEMIVKTEAESYQKKFITPFQSELSGIIAKQIIQNKEKPLLPSYLESARQHKLMLNAFISHYGKIINKKIDYCPIT